MNRIYWIDGLRVVSAIAVILIHTSAFLVLNTPTGSASWWVGNVVDSFSRWAVPVFIMISGYLLIKPESNVEITKVYKKRIPKTLLVISAWLIIYYFIGYVMKGLAINDWFKLIIESKPYPGHLYFMFIIIGLYFALPFLNILLTNLGKSKFTRLSVLTLLFIIFGSMFLFFFDTQLFQRNIFMYWLPFLGFFMIGYSLKNFEKSLGYKIHAIIFFTSSSLIAILTYLFSKNGDLLLYFYGYLTPFVVISSLSIFRFFEDIGLSIKSSKTLTTIISRLANLTLGVYLIHMIYILIFIDFFSTHLDNYSLAVLLTFFFTVLMSFSSVFILKKIAVINNIM